MSNQTKSIRPFIGAKDFEISRQFYRHLNFEETVITPKMSVFKSGNIAFYLQDAYVKDWIDNTMIFVEVEEVSKYHQEILSLKLTEKFENVKLSSIRIEHWGSEFFLHDPSGILWHFGTFV